MRSLPAPVPASPRSPAWPREWEKPVQLLVLRKSCWPGPVPREENSPRRYRGARRWKVPRSKGLPRPCRRLRRTGRVDGRPVDAEGVRLQARLFRWSDRERECRFGDDFLSSWVRDAEGEVDQALGRIAGCRGHNDLVPLDLLFEDGTGIDPPVGQRPRRARYNQRAEDDQDADEKERSSRSHQKMGWGEQTRDRLSVAQARYNCDLFKGLAALRAAAGLVHLDRSVDVHVFLVPRDLAPDHIAGIADQHVGIRRIFASLVGPAQQLILSHPPPPTPTPLWNPSRGAFRSPCRRSAEAGAESKALKTRMWPPPTPRNTGPS